MRTVRGWGGARDTIKGTWKCIASSQAKCSAHGKNKQQKNVGTAAGCLCHHIYKQGSGDLNSMMRWFIRLH